MAAGFPTLKSWWPWPWIGSSYRRASLIDLYIHAKFHWNRRNFLWTYCNAPDWSVSHCMVSRENSAPCDAAFRQNSLTICYPRPLLAADMHAATDSGRGSSSSSQVQNASTHKSAKTYSCDVIVTRDFGLWPSDPEINEFPGIILEHFYAKFHAPIFEISCGKTGRHADKRR